MRSSRDHARMFRDVTHAEILAMGEAVIERERTDLDARVDEMVTRKITKIKNRLRLRHDAEMQQLRMTLSAKHTAELEKLNAQMDDIVNERVAKTENLLQQQSAEVLCDAKEAQRDEAREHLLKVKRDYIRKLADEKDGIVKEERSRYEEELQRIRLVYESDLDKEKRKLNDEIDLVNKRAADHILQYSVDIAKHQCQLDEQREALLEEKGAVAFSFQCEKTELLDRIDAHDKAICSLRVELSREREIRAELFQAASGQNAFIETVMKTYINSDDNFLLPLIDYSKFAPS